jgi:hypothetical protein
VDNEVKTLVDLNKYGETVTIYIIEICVDFIEKSHKNVFITYLSPFYVSV